MTIESRLDPAPAGEQPSLQVEAAHRWRPGVAGMKILVAKNRRPMQRTGRDAQLRRPTGTMWPMPAMVSTRPT
ncbi:hypothetical protein GCM10007933_34660 [Zoogloea oryzae]|uniref:Uncharacterized protein n=1 Tax=Zoogloea oryzae TaxID=310767 RepID=A0ABQ6FEG5_9RHOO|nr:hypothetical protein GCM10007933_34660 [Zoogloea oryzae]